MENRLHSIIPLICPALIATLVAVSPQNIAYAQGAATSSIDNASTTASIFTPTLADVLRQFQDEIQSLNSQVADLRFESELSGLKGVFARTLRRGDTGDDVSKLQELLEKFPGLYLPGADVSSAITGFYGSATKVAVAQFQSQMGLKKTGVFDAKTKEKLYGSLSVLDRETATAEIAPIDTSPAADLNNAVGSQTQTLSGLRANIADIQAQMSSFTSDLSIVKDDIANLEEKFSEASQQTATTPVVSLSPSSPTAPAQTALVVSNVSAQNITSSGANIKWTTNTSADSRVEYGLTQQYSGGAIDPKLVASHSIVLTDLTKNTTYHYLVKSIDAKGNVATSADQIFTTLAK